MAYSSHSIKFDVGISLNLYGKPLDFKIMHALGESVLNYPRITRNNDTDAPYLIAIPSKNMLCGDAVWDKYSTYPVQGLQFKIEIDRNEYENYAFAFFRSNPDNVEYRTYKEDGGDLTFGQFTNIQGDDLSPVLLGIKNNNVTEIAKYFSEYTTNSHTLTVDFGNYTANRTITMQHLFASQSNWNYEGCAPKFYSNVAVFDTIENATNYLLTGATDGLMDEVEEEPDIPEEYESEVYFYEVYNEYYSDLALTNHILTTNQKYTITFEDYPKGTTPIHAQVINNKYMNNVQFIVTNGYGQYITSASSRIGNIEVPITTDILSTFMAIRTNYGILEDTVNDRYCKTIVFTNMPIIGVDGSAVPGRIPDSDDMISAENGANYDCGLSECWLLDTENVSKLASIFNTTIDRSGPGATELVLAEWVQGLSCYSNPLDVVCDLFYIPINVSEYISGSSKSFTLQPSING